MNGKKLARLIVLIIIAAALTAILCMAINLNAKNIFNFAFKLTDFDDYKQYSEFSVDSSEIDDISIEMINENISFEKSEDNSIKIIQRDISESAKPVLISCENGELYILSGYTNNFLNSLSSDIIVFIPEGFNGSISAESVSGDICGVIEGALDELRAESAGGNISLETFKASNINIETTSGNIDFTSESSYIIDMESTSGDVFAHIKNSPHEIGAQSISGNIEIYLPKGTAVDLDIEKISGELKCDLERSKNAATEIDVETISGNIIITEYK